MLRTCQQESTVPPRSIDIELSYDRRTTCTYLGTWSRSQMTYMNVTRSDTADVNVRIRLRARTAFKPLVNAFLM